MWHTAGMPGGNITFDPLYDPKVKKIEITYQKFLNSVALLSQEQQRIIADAVAQLDERKWKNL